MCLARTFEAKSFFNLPALLASSKTLVNVSSQQLKIAVALAEKFALTSPISMAVLPISQPPTKFFFLCLAKTESR